ncbi:hypothetical protein [Shimia sp. Alg240-R146]|uniref:hypothetical protein n=1 Tax=Shimia sp. Alg240-R146 TaxID=2993449 RepID=UPI0022DF5303|nr:hypothetical protein [Shimia sp. Alg240-R146]
MFYGDRSLYDARGSCFQNARLVSVNSDLDQQVVFAIWRCEAVTVDGNEIVEQLITEAFGRNNSCHQKASYWYVVTRKSEPLPRYGVDFARNC